MLCARNESNAKGWFTDQYENLIGKPLPRKELASQEVLKKLKDSAEYRWISEAKVYKAPEPQTDTAHYLEWNDPQIEKCMCPDYDCTCRGGVIFPRKKIPRGERYLKSPLGRKLMQCFKKPVAPPRLNFMQRLAEVVGMEASFQKDLEKKGILSIRGAEFCTSRCIRYYGAENFPKIKHPLDQQKLRDKKLEIPPSDETDEKGRICQDRSCTVSSQATVDSDGEFIIGNFSHVLFATLDDTVVRDINGINLHISSYKCVNDNSRYAPDNLCSLEKLRSLRKLINSQKLKNHFSLIKRNIYSSIFEMKEPNSSTRTLTTQYEEQYATEKSSEKISIATPYKGVVMKIKKELQQDYTVKEMQQEVPQAQNNHSYDITPNILNRQSGSQGLDTDSKSFVLTDIKEFIHKEIFQKQNQIESAERKIICDSYINQERQEQSLLEQKACDALITGLPSKDMTSTHK